MLSSWAGHSNSQFSDELIFYFNLSAALWLSSSWEMELKWHIIPKLGVVDIYKRPRTWTRDAGPNRSVMRENDWRGDFSVLFECKLKPPQNLENLNTIEFLLNNKKELPAQPWRENSGDRPLVPCLWHTLLYPARHYTPSGLEQEYLTWCLQI